MEPIMLKCPVDFNVIWPSIALLGGLDAEGFYFAVKVGWFEAEGLGARS
jgi:hypothetical protein